MRDIATGLAVAALGTYIAVTATGMPDATTVTNDPSLLPQLIGGLLIVCGLVVIGKGVYRLRTGAAEHIGSAVPLPDVEALDELQAEHRNAQPRADLGTTATVAVAMIVYGALAFRLGYLSVTFVFLCGLPLVLGWPPRGRHLLVLLGFAAAVVIGIRLIFVTGLNVPLPETPLP